MKPSTDNKATKTLYIGNLRYKRDEESLKGQFSKYGRVLWVKLVKKPGKEDHNTGIAFMEMQTAAQAQEIIKKVNGKIVDGRTIKISIAEEDNEIFQAKKREPSFEELEEIAVKAQANKRPKKFKSSTNAPFDFKARFL